jgi:hypothetical protein
MDQKVVPVPAFVAAAVVVDYAIEMGVGTTCFAGRAAVGPQLKMVVALAEKRFDSASVDGLGRELTQQHAVAAVVAAAVAAAVVAVVAAVVAAVVVAAAELELLHS